MIERLLQELAKIKGAKFASFDYSPKVGGSKFDRATGTNISRVTSGVNRYNVLLGVDTETSYERQVAHLTALLPTLTGLDAVAGQELLDSLHESLEGGIGNNSRYTQRDVAYLPFPGLPNVWTHPNGTLSIRAKVQSSVVLVAAEWRTVKSSPKTLAKDALRAGLPSSGFATFNLRDLSGARLNGNTLEI